MIHLNPKTVSAVKIEIVSWGRKASGEASERRVSLGVFEPDVTEDELQSAIEKYDLQYDLLGTLSLQKGRARLYRRPVEMQSGVIFESAEECCKYLNQGVNYKDIVRGCEFLNSQVYERD